MNNSQREEMYVQVVQKAWEDGDFKKRLVDNPIETIESFIGKPLNIPEGKTFVVRDQTDDSMVYVNIPHKSVTENTELSEEQLDAVSGGVYGNGCDGPDMQEIRKLIPSW